MRVLRALLSPWVDRESDIDTVTALSGSGPAYFFLLMAPDVRGLRWPVIDGYKQMILRAHSAGIKIYGGTLTPWWDSIFTGDNWTIEKWEKHQAINDWIRTSGDFDGVVDFDKCLADPDNPEKMLPIYDSGDHLHPGDLGYVHMGHDSSGQDA